MIVDIVSEPESEFGLNDGVATANPSGGTAPYLYLWDTGETTQTVSDLGTGWHYVKVMDNAQVVQVAFVQITLLEQEYDFNMTDSSLECFLKVASCKYGDKAHDYFEQSSKGFRNNKCSEDLFLLHKNIQTASCWRPQSNVSVEQPSYFIINFVSYNQATETGLTISILGFTLFYPFHLATSLATNLAILVDYINESGTPFKAQTEGLNLFIFAPSGYCGIMPTVSLTDGNVVLNVISTLGFQDGYKPCGSYVDWQGVYHEAPEDCLDQDQVGNIIDNIKKFVDCECLATTDILNDDID